MLFRIESTGRHTHHIKAGESDMLLHRKGKLTTAKSKSSRYSKVVSLPLESILNAISNDDADLSDSLVSFILSSSEYNCSMTGEKSRNQFLQFFSAVQIEVSFG
jgi:hypothetical protein